MINDNTVRVKKEYIDSPLLRKYVERQLIKELPFPENNLLILIVVYYCGYASMNDIIEQSCILTQNAHPYVNNLISKGYLNKIEGKPYKKYTLTPKASAFITTYNRLYSEKLNEAIIRLERIKDFKPGKHDMGD